MARLVMKFGGTSVADLDRIRNVARHVKREVDAGYDVAVVVSAMAGVTNQLVEWCRQAAMLHDAREYDAVVATGEEVTAGLLAIVLEGMGVNARSWQGWQLPILTDNAHGSARILDVNGAELIKRFKEHRSGRSRCRLPGHAQGNRARHARSAAAAPIRRRWRSRPLSAPSAATSIPMWTASTPPIRAWCPRRIGWTRSRTEEMLELASLGAKVMQVRSVELGMVHNVRIFVRSSFESLRTSILQEPPSGTLYLRRRRYRGTASRHRDRLFQGRGADLAPSGAGQAGVAAAIFGPLADSNINVDMIVQNVSARRRQRPT